VRIFRGASRQRYLKEAFVVKSPRHHLDEFVVIMLADIFELSAPIVRIQMQSDLQGTWISHHCVFPCLEKRKEGMTHVESHRARSQLPV
jgi:hypothetical protein